MRRSTSLLRTRTVPATPSPVIARHRYSTPSNQPPCTKYTKPTHLDGVLPASSSNNHVLPVYARPPFVLSHGKGSWLYTTSDTGSRKYLDFTAGIAVNALGHADAEFAKVIGEQAGTLLHTSNVFWNGWAIKLADLLVKTTQRDGGLGWAAGQGQTGTGQGARVFFSSSGTEANEGAFKFARKIGKERWAEKTGRSWEEAASPAAPHKHRIACFENAFHGRSMGALSATTNAKYQKPFEPLVPGFDVGKINDIDGIQTLIGEETCAVIVEPVQGEGGLSVASEAFLRALRKRCDEVGAVLIFDEIQCGLYRTGTMWAHSKYPVDCHPDIITMAKPLANGYPIGAIMMRERFAHHVTVGSHGTTFGGSPLATRLGHHVLGRLSTPSFSSHVQSVSSRMRTRLTRLAEAFPSLVEPGPRGRGLLTGLGFYNTEDPAKVVQMMRERGVLILTAGKDAIRIVPSLVVKEEEVDMACDVLESCMVVLKGEKEKH